MTDFSTWFNQMIQGQNLDADYTTNSPSYYDDLARRSKLMQLLTEKIWGYDQELAERFAAWDKNLEEFDAEVLALLQRWLEDGTLDHIINDTIFAWKADKVDLDATTLKIDNLGIHASSFPRLTGETDDTGRLQRAIDYAGVRGATLFIPAGTYTFSDTLDVTYDSLKIHGVKGKTILLYSGTARRAISFDQGGVVGTTVYGNSLVNFEFVGIELNADFTQARDEFDRPISWYDATGLYLNGCRNLSFLKECKFYGFNRGVHSVFNWMFNYYTNWFQNCKEGLVIEEESNNITLTDNIFRRCGDVRDFSGVACKIIGSYAIVLSNNDIEDSNCEGFVYENCHSVVHMAGDIEGNDTSTRKIVIRGRQGNPLTDRYTWSYGFEILGVRFRRSLGLLFGDGTRNVRVSGNTFSTTSTGAKSNAFTITTSGTLIEDIDIGTNDYYGDNKTYTHNIPIAMLKQNDAQKFINKQQVLESQELDVTNTIVTPIGFFPTKVKINRIQFAQSSAVGPGTVLVDMGVGLDVGTVMLSKTFTGGSDYSLAPFGITEVTGFTADQVSGTLRVRLKSNTIASGKIRVRVFYETII